LPLSAKLKKGLTQTQQTGHGLVGSAAALLSPAAKTAPLRRRACQALIRKPGLFIQAGLFSLWPNCFSKFNADPITLS
jgi:hypothetical protein